MKKFLKPLIYLLGFVLSFVLDRFVFAHPILRVAAMVFGVLLFHETVSVKQLLGCALAVAGVVLFVRADAEEAGHET